MQTEGATFASTSLSSTRKLPGRAGQYRVATYSQAAMKSPSGGALRCFAVTNH